MLFFLNLSKIQAFIDELKIINQPYLLFTTTVFFNTNEDSKMKSKMITEVNQMYSKNDEFLYLLYKNIKDDFESFNFKNIKNEINKEIENIFKSMVVGSEEMILSNPNIMTQSNKEDESSILQLKNHWSNLKKDTFSNAVNSIAKLRFILGMICDLNPEIHKKHDKLDHQLNIALNVLNFIFNISTIMKDKKFEKFYVFCDPWEKDFFKKFYKGFIRRIIDSSDIKNTKIESNVKIESLNLLENIIIKNIETINQMSSEPNNLISNFRVLKPDELFDCMKTYIMAIYFACNEIEDEKDLIRNEKWKNFMNKFNF